VNVPKTTREYLLAFPPAEWGKRGNAIEEVETLLFAGRRSAVPSIPSREMAEHLGQPMVRGRGNSVRDVQRAHSQG
jgi:hypothetical protein